MAAVNPRDDKPWLNPVFRVVHGATIADRILASGEHELVIALKLGELEGTGMVPSNRMQERLDRFLITCEDKERAIANFAMGKSLCTDAKIVYCRYFTPVGQAANDNVERKDRPVLPRMHSGPFTPEAAGGIMKDVASWITSTAITPVPELSLAAAVAFIGGMFGDRALGPTESGTNLFLTTIMKSGGGKGHPPKRIIELASLAGKQGAVTNGDPTSYAAIERILRRNKSTVVVMDEFGITLQDVNGKSGAASASIRKFLLAIYDQANSLFHGRTYASADTKPDDSPIEGPALTVLGMTTEETLRDGLSEDSVSSGFLNRFLFVTGTRPADIRLPGLSRRSKKPPKELVERLTKANAGFPVGADAGNLAFMKKAIVPFEGDEDGEAYKLWGEIFMWQNWQGWSRQESNINGRAAENTVRLATIRAISRDPLAPVIEVEDVEWGWGIVHNSIQVVTDLVQRMAGSESEALRNAIVAALESAPDKTFAWSHLLQREGVRKAKSEEVSAALMWLIETGKVRSSAGDRKPGNRMKFTLA